MPVINPQAMREARAAPGSKLASAYSAHSAAAAIELPPRIDWRKRNSPCPGRVRLNSPRAPRISNYTAAGSNDRHSGAASAR